MAIGDEALLVRKVAPFMLMTTSTQANERNPAGAILPARFHHLFPAGRITMVQQKCGAMERRPAKSW
ncbi:hypothetical protein BDBG_17138 [Blastomyces gilchristii SLH14081]|uniref:Uncharacterized protein n=1 Tax=Blastomyces gilchristii (strain SLH14081) TaxID=559298 RepID=A0A179UPL4_BLAGS|nr:uncharacterized protein BDBG_17138 [Blastomyces gilchristii SLH14081]OAT08971.1 hypothetical protein BDBG_17138 [Blastomyces gilchristii SLH14081]